MSENEPCCPGPATLELIAVTYKWSGKQFELKLPFHATIEELKCQIFSQTRVMPHRQKLIGLCKGKLPSDQEQLSVAIGGRSTVSFVVIGPPEEEIVKDWDPSQIPAVINDLDTDYWPAPGDLASDPEIQRTLQQVVTDHEVVLIHPPRKGQRLLVLDLDYTLFDLKGASDDINDLCRPFLHEFLISVYAHYDICVWSQTHWKYIEMKMTDMGMLTHPDYKISFVLDISVMFKVTARHSGTVMQHYIKPLEFIWRKLPSFYGPQNTIHIDDLSRNFAMNPRNGLKIRQWRHSTKSRETDRELCYLMRYLNLIASVEDFTTLDHSEWRRYLQDH